MGEDKGLSACLAAGGGDEGWHLRAGLFSRGPCGATSWVTWWWQGTTCQLGTQTSLGTHRQVALWSWDAICCLVF